jgi:hypothetical protein
MPMDDGRKLFVVSARRELRAKQTEKRSRRRRRESEHSENRQFPLCRRAASKNAGLSSLSQSQTRQSCDQGATLTLNRGNFLCFKTATQAKSMFSFSILL